LLLRRRVHRRPDRRLQRLSSRARWLWIWPNFTGRSNRADTLLDRVENHIARAAPWATEVLAATFRIVPTRVSCRECNRLCQARIHDGRTQSATRSRPWLNLRMVPGVGRAQGGPPMQQALPSLGRDCLPSSSERSKPFWRFSTVNRTASYQWAAGGAPPAIRGRRITKTSGVRKKKILCQAGFRQTRAAYHLHQRTVTAPGDCRFKAKRRGAGYGKLFSRSV